MFKIKIFQNQSRNDKNEKPAGNGRNGRNARWLSHFTSDNLVMIEMSFFPAEGKAKLKKMTKDQVLERTFNGKMKFKQ
jgi:hypothetical protein